MTRDSPKKTMGHWVNSSGLFEARQVDLIMHHRPSGVGQTARAYMEVELAGPLEMQKVLFEHIKNGTFMPDQPIGAILGQRTIPWRAHP